MDRLDTMRVFVAVAEARGFAAGARRLGRSAPVVTRAVADLERRLGTRLLQRTTRIVRLTEAGTAISRIASGSSPRWTRPRNRCARRMASRVAPSR